MRLSRSHNRNYGFNMLTVVALVNPISCRIKTIFKKYIYIILNFFQVKISINRASELILDY
jgi:hypothetical protein